MVRLPSWSDLLCLSSIGGAAALILVNAGDLIGYRSLAFQHQRIPRRLPEQNIISHPAPDAQPFLT
jgi:hypothetical protein